jgi:serine/threonine protein kinase
VYESIAAGGMATVHFGRLIGPEGFTRTVAVKRMHPHLAKEPEFVAMFLDEARLAARIRHPNVVSTLDVAATGGELLIVMEYVHGESLGSLMHAVGEAKERVPVPVACAIVADLLAGLHAAHEARDERGEPLRIVHRDVSPQNILVGLDGVSRVLDFGVAKAVGRVQQTREGQVKGKIAYMAPEQVRGGTITRATDIYAASVVLWETLTARRLFGSERDAEVVDQILFGSVDAPSARAASVPEALNAVVLRGLARDPADRYETARDMVRALRDCVHLASASEVGDWVERVGGDALVERASKLAELDRSRDLVTSIRMRRRRADESGGHTFEETAAVVLPREAIGTDAMVTGVDPLAEARPTRGRRRRVVVAALATVSLLAVGGVVAVRASIAHRPGAIATPAAAVSLAVASVTEALPPPPSSTATASVVAEATSSPGHAPRPPASATRSRRRPGCDPPYTTDPDGTRHYKLQCL